MGSTDALRVCLHLLRVLDKIKSLKFIAKFHDKAPWLMFFNQDIDFNKVQGKIKSDSFFNNAIHNYVSNCQTQTAI